MDLTEEEVQEFKNEAAELLDQAERELLALEKGGDYASTYSAVFPAMEALSGKRGWSGRTTPSALKCSVSADLFESLVP
jgi:chemotaxis protein histidine kinase CheA